MTASPIPAFRWDAANSAPQPEAVLTVPCTEGHEVAVPHRVWHLVDDLRCQTCGCLADVYHARRHWPCPCDAAVIQFGQQAGPERGLLSLATAA